MQRYLFIIFFLITTLLLTSIPTEANTRSREEYEKTGHAIWEIKTNKKMIAITFDDGPHPVYTPQILDILAKYNAKATFFVIGKKVDEHPDVIKRIVKEGHEVANHTYNHTRGNKMNSKKLVTELDKTAESIKSITNIKPTLFRPVGGFYNDLIINTAVKNNYLVVMWSWHQDPKDWNGTNANKISKHVISSAKPGDIVLLHDSGGDRTKTVNALDPILDFLTKNNFECVTVSDMLFYSNNHSEHFCK